MHLKPCFYKTQTGREKSHLTPKYLKYKYDLDIFKNLWNPMVIYDS